MILLGERRQTVHIFDFSMKHASIYIYIFFNLILKCSLQAYVRHRNILISCIIEFLLASFQLKFIYFSNSVFKPKYISF